MKSIGGFFISRVEDEADETTVEPPPPMPPSARTVAEMAASAPLPVFAEASGDDLSNTALPDIYAAAGVSDAGFTVDKLAALLEDPMLRDQPLSAKTLVLKMALKAQNVAPEMPVMDAVNRDRALDAYQAMLNRRAHESEAANAQLIQQINEQVRAFLEQKNAEMDALRTEIQEMKRQSENFAARRLEEERRLAELVVPLLEGQANPVSVGNVVEG